MLGRRLGRGLRRLWRIVYALVGGAILMAVVIAGFLYYELSGDDPETFFDNPVKQFKYGSTGGDLLAGLPAGIFKAMPMLCRDYLPGKGWESLGFIFEEGMDRPVGTSRRHSLGFDRIALNCAACHVGTYRDVPQSPRRVPTRSGSQRQSRHSWPRPPRPESPARADPRNRRCKETPSLLGTVAHHHDAGRPRSCETPRAR